MTDVVVILAATVLDVDLSGMERLLGGPATGLPEGLVAVDSGSFNVQLGSASGSPFESSLIR